MSYAPAGRLSPAETTWTRRLRAAAIDLGWRIVGRDEDGHLVAATTLRCGTREPNVLRHCTLTHTPAGLVHRVCRETVPVTKRREDV